MFWSALVKLISIFTEAVSESWNVSDKYTWDNAEDLTDNYSWIRFSVRMIGSSKRQFFHMVTHVFDKSDLSQEIFTVDTWGAVICSLGHGRKHMLTIFNFRPHEDQAQSLKRPGLRPRGTVSYFINYNIINFRLLFESDIALFLNEAHGPSSFDEKIGKEFPYLPHLRWWGNGPTRYLIAHCRSALNSSTT